MTEYCHSVHVCTSYVIVNTGMVGITILIKQLMTIVGSQASKQKNNVLHSDRYHVELKWRNGSVRASVTIYGIKSNNIFVFFPE